MINSKHKKILDVAVFLFILWIFSWVLSKIDLNVTPLPVPSDRWGNASFSDFLTMMAGQHFHDEGYWQNYFLGNMTEGFREFARGWYYYQVPLLVPNSAIYYTHYGALDGMVNGALRFLGIVELKTFYKTAALLSAIGLGLWYIAARRLFGVTVAAISVAFIGTNVLYLRFFESIAAYSYDLTLSFAAVFLFVTGDRQPAGRRRQLVFLAAWLAVFLQATNSPEWILWLQVTLLGYLWISHGPILALSRDRGLHGFSVKLAPSPKLALALATLSAPVIAQLLHLAQAAWALGGVNNLMQDILAALARRTGGFALAAETPFQAFRLADAPGFVHRVLTHDVQLNLLQILALIAFCVACIAILGQKLDPSWRARSVYRLKLVIVVLAAGIIFWIALPQATITSTDTTMRLILPGAGLLLGLATALLVQSLRTAEIHAIMRAGSAAVYLAIVVPFVILKVHYSSFDYATQQSSLGYLGLLPAEIQALGDFVQDHTRYGDIILTGIDVGNTGHPEYPHPAYEYLSQRRFEVAHSLANTRESFERFESVRVGLPATNPARDINYYYLFSPSDFDPEFSSFATCVGEIAGTLDLNDWWTDQRGGVPDRGDGEHQAPLLFLYKLNASRVADCAPYAPVVPAALIAPQGEYSQLALRPTWLRAESVNKPSESPTNLAGSDPKTFWSVQVGPGNRPMHRHIGFS